jgi:Glycosyl hydrolases family 35
MKGPLWLLAFALAIVAPATARAGDIPAQWSSWNTSAVVQDRGYPVFTVDGKPFFVYGAAFFYARIPRSQWLPALQTYRMMGINTLDLYVIWNWHEPSEGVRDFTGKTDPRRDLAGLLALAHQQGFKIVLRPGPVIRNEWRNGGYPAWLLSRPEYDMPQHDILEGRYPATATLQNTHADAAADEWLHNATHLKYASGWLHDVLVAAAPYAHDVIAIALDDDQGAYIDNDTWPAPHWHEYTGWLRSTVQATAGTRVPLFINTFQEKVPAASPAWAWGDWYQSDAFRIGTHDLAQLDFATGLLQTQSHVPVMVAEFQAGWLQGADEAAPRPSDPSNTAVALEELLRLGAHGVVNFPAQDTIYPDGWEAPWANWSYAWNAALAYNLQQSPRYAPTAQFGDDMERYGPALARTHVAADAAIVWPPSLFPASALTNPDFGAFADATIAMQQDCTHRHLACDLIDLRFADAATLARYHELVLPVAFPNAFAHRMLPAMQRLIGTLTRSGKLRRSLGGVAPNLSGGRDATLLLADDGTYGFVAAINPSDTPRVAGPFVAKLASGLVRVDAVPLPAHSAKLVPVLAPMSPIPPYNMLIATPPTPLPWDRASGKAHAFPSSLFIDGPNDIYIQNDRLRSAFAPNAGGRIALLEMVAGDNAATSIGLLRDAVDPVQSPSARDYIAAYTHPMPAGTFNRTYDCHIALPGDKSTSVACAYTAPDLPPGGARFSRALALDAGGNSLTVDETFAPNDAASTARLQSISGFAFVQGDVLIAPPHATYVGILHGTRLAWLSWRPEDVASADVRASRGAQIVTLVFSAQHVEYRLGIAPVADQAEALRLLQANPASRSK